MPSDHLAEKVHRLLFCAAPDQLPNLPELVRHAIDSDMSDDEVLNMLCHRYQVGRDGWPLDPEARRAARIERFFQINAPLEYKKAEILIRQKDLDEIKVMDSLKEKYGRDEYGEHLDHYEKLKERLQHMFQCVAPERIGEIPALINKCQQTGIPPDEFYELLCREHHVGKDGWPNDPVERKRARLTRFFLTNSPSDLRKVESLVIAECTEAEVMMELHEKFGKDEFGNDIKSHKKLREKLVLLFQAANPDGMDAIDGLIRYQTKRGLGDEDVLLLAQRQFNVGPDGWPMGAKERLKARVTRFFLSNRPNELHKTESLLNLQGTSEDEIMKMLYQKYRVDEFGKPIDDSDEILLDKLYSFYEQYVGPDDVEQMVRQAQGLNLPEDTLFALLKERYKGLSKRPNPLREQVQLIYQRAAPDQIHQIPMLMQLKRTDKLSDADLLHALSGKYNVGLDGWPEDEKQRRRRRLIIFFQNNDPDRLEEVDGLCDPSSEDYKPEEKLFEELFQHYKKDELGKKIKKKKGDGKKGAASGIEVDTSSEEGERVGSSAVEEHPSFALTSERVDPQGLGEEVEDEEQRQMYHSGFGANVSAENPYRAFVPGMTQLWPPPDQNNIEALYESELMKDMIRKYGGSIWSHAQWDDPNDSFSRLSRLHDNAAGSAPSPTTRHKNKQAVRSDYIDFYPEMTIGQYTAQLARPTYPVASGEVKTRGPPPQGNYSPSRPNHTSSPTRNRTSYLTSSVGAMSIPEELKHPAHRKRFKDGHVEVMRQPKRHPIQEMNMASMEILKDIQAKEKKREETRRIIERGSKTPSVHFSHHVQQGGVTASSVTQYFREPIGKYTVKTKSSLFLPRATGNAEEEEERSTVMEATSSDAFPILQQLLANQKVSTSHRDRNSSPKNSSLMFGNEACVEIQHGGERDAVMARAIQTAENALLHVKSARPREVQSRNLMNVYHDREWIEDEQKYDHLVAKFDLNRKGEAPSTDGEALHQNQPTPSMAPGTKPMESYRFGVRPKSTTTRHQHPSQISSFSPFPNSQQQVSPNPVFAEESSRRSNAQQLMSNNLEMPPEFSSMSKKSVIDFRTPGSVMRDEVSRKVSFL